MASKREVFSRNLRNAIAKSYLNQSQLADICGISKGSFSDWCNARSYPRPEKMELLVNALGVTEYDLTTDFEGNDDSQYMNRDVSKIAKELYENPDARGLYDAISRLPKDDFMAAKQIVFSLLQAKKD